MLEGIRLDLTSKTAKETERTAVAELADLCVGRTIYGVSVDTQFHSLDDHHSVSAITVELDGDTLVELRAAWHNDTTAGLYVTFRSA